MNQEKNNKESIDLSGMVKDSGERFQDERQQPGQTFYPGIYSGTPKIIQKVIKYSGGLIKNERQAIYVILGFIVLAIVISLFLFFGGGEIKPLYKEDLMGPEGIPLRQ